MKSMNATKISVAVLVALAAAGCAKKEETPAAAASAPAAAAPAAPPAEIVIPGEQITPESLTSTADGHVIIGSIQARTIWRAAPGATTAEAWIQPGTDGMQGVFGVFADDNTGTLYACSGSFGAPPSNGPPPPPSTLHTFDLATGAPKGKYPLPDAGAFCNDIAVDAKGNIYVTDTQNMLVDRLVKGGTKLETWAGKDGSLGAKGGVLDGIAILGDRVLVNALMASKLYAVPIGADGAAGKAVEIKTNRVIDRPDGMRSFGNDLLVAEGGGAGRLSRVTVTGDSGTATTVKEGFPDGPVAVTVVGTTAYVLEGQLALMMNPPKPGTPPPPARPYKATAVDVGKP
jgi:sugar lactone lactonase YvrE